MFSIEISGGAGSADALEDLKSTIERELLTAVTRSTNETSSPYADPATLKATPPMGLGRRK